MISTPNGERIVILICALALLAISCGQSHKVCAVCQRDECAGFTFRVKLEDGKQIETCCPRCGMWYVKSAGQRAREMWATDFDSGKRIDATKAAYVSGSDVSYCSQTETRRDGYGCCFYKGFDRCQPSLIAFESAAAAQVFQKQHGGELLTSIAATSASAN